MKNTNWKVPVIIGVGVLAVILMIVFGVQSSQNKAIALEEQVNTASSDIKVQEKRRVDLVYNLADCVKQYDKHEADTEGITGYMYGCAVSILSQCWKYGEYLRKWHNKEYNYDGDGVVNPAILTIG